MFPSLYEKLGQLPRDTKVRSLSFLLFVRSGIFFLNIDAFIQIYVGHEYTLSNYQFALSVDPENQALIIANEKAKISRQDGLPTVPSTIEAEFMTNPFLRAEHLMLPGEDHCVFLNRLREAKNNFK